MPCLKLHPSESSSYPTNGVSFCGLPPALLTFAMNDSMMLRRIGPRIWLSSLVICWGCVTLGGAWVKSYHDFVICRVLLGLFEAGMYQGCFYTISCWYLPNELQSRCAWWYSATLLSGAFGGLLAYAVGPLQDHHGLRQWQWLFIIEGMDYHCQLAIWMGIHC